MSLWFSYLGLAAVWVGFVFFAFLFFYFGANKKKYNRLIELYHEHGLSFYAPYHFHSLVGFFGSFTLVYYFLCLLKKKAPLFMWNDNKNVYSFFDRIPSDLYNWMHWYYRITVLCICSYAFVFFMVLAKFVAEHFFSP